MGPCIMPSPNNNARGWQKLPPELKEPILEYALVSDKPIPIYQHLSRSSLEVFLQLLKRGNSPQDLRELWQLLCALPQPNSPTFEDGLLQIRFWNPNLFHRPSDIPFRIHKATKTGDLDNFLPLYIEYLKWWKTGPKFERDDPINAATGLFRVNREMWHESTRIFYGQNRFEFPNGFVTMQAWLGAIGSNARWARNLSVEAPLTALGPRNCPSKHQLGNMMMEFLLQAGVSPGGLGRGLRQISDATINPLSVDTLLQRQQWTAQPGIRRNLCLVVHGDKWIERLDEERVENFDPDRSVWGQLEYLAEVPRDMFNISIVFILTPERVPLRRNGAWFKIYRRIERFRELFEKLGCKFWVENWENGEKELMDFDQWLLLGMRMDFKARHPGVPLPQYLTDN